MNHPEGVRSGVWVFPDRPAPELVELAVFSEALGLDEFWIGDEGPAREPFSVLAAAAARTATIRLGIGVTNPYTRAPGLTASTAMTLHEMTDGRFTLGIGAGGQLSLGPFGLSAEAPVQAVGDLIEVVKAARSGTDRPGYAAQEHAVRGSVDGCEPAIFIGARGRRLNELASKAADGVFIAGMPPFRFAAAIAAARSQRDVAVAVYPGVAFDAEALDRQRPQMIWALLDAPDEVRTRFGLSESAVQEAAAELVTGREAAARRLVTDAIARELILVGDPDVVGRELAVLARQHKQTSVGLALIEHLGTDDLVRCAEAMRVFAQHQERA